jgi:dihydrofolate reductase
LHTPLYISEIEGFTLIKPQIFYEVEYLDNFNHFRNIIFAGDDTPPQEEFMRKVIYAMSLSLDGYVEDVNGDIRWTDPGEELHQYFNDRESLIDMHLYGRRLYENMAAAWPIIDADPSAPKFMREYARIWMDKPKVVFSKTLEKVDWNSRLVKGDLVEEVNRLKAQPGQYMVVGGPNLAASFMRHGLIDEFWLYYLPIVLGGGKAMFPALEKRVNLELVETRRFSSGVVLLRYQQM